MEKEKFPIQENKTEQKEIIEKQEMIEAKMEGEKMDARVEILERHKIIVAHLFGREEG